MGKTDFLYLTHTEKEISMRKKKLFLARIQGEKFQDMHEPILNEIIDVGFLFDEQAFKFNF